MKGPKVHLLKIWSNQLLQSLFETKGETISIFTFWWRTGCLLANKGLRMNVLWCIVTLLRLLFYRNKDQISWIKLRFSQIFISKKTLFNSLLFENNVSLLLGNLSLLFGNVSLLFFIIMHHGCLRLLVILAIYIALSFCFQ